MRMLTIQLNSVIPLSCSTPQGSGRFVNTVHQLKGLHIRGCPGNGATPFFVCQGSDLTPTDTESSRRLLTNRDYEPSGLSRPELPLKTETGHSVRNRKRWALFLSRWHNNQPQAEPGAVGIEVSTLKTLALQYST